VFIVADKGPKPYRVHNRSPSFHNLSVMDHVCRGYKLADLVAILATIDIVVPDIDR
jgi:NADH-quinone oxidoreductase subunit D